MSPLANSCPRCDASGFGAKLSCNACLLVLDNERDIIRYPVGKYIVQMQDFEQFVDTIIIKFIQQRYLGNWELPINVTEEQLDLIWEKA